MPCGAVTGAATGATDAGARIRLDKWLWHARIFKTRSLAARQVRGGLVRVNGAKTVKPAQPVGPGDTLTFALGGRVRVLRIRAAGARRGPAPEAQALYADLSPPASDAPGAPVSGKGGRPTKKDRRRLDQSRLPPLE